MLLWRLDVPVRLLPLRKLGRTVRNLFVGDAAENMCDAVETRPFLVVRRYDVPRRSRSIRRLQHGIARTRIVIPAAVRLQVHWAQLPALGWILNSREEALVLFLFRYFEPVFQKDDALADQKALEDGTVPDKLPVLFVGTKSHYALNTGPVIPAPVEDDDFTSGGQSFNVALGMQLRLLSLGGRGQSHQTKHTGTDALDDAFDDSAFPGGVAPQK